VLWAEAEIIFQQDIQGEAAEKAAGRKPSCITPLKAALIYRRLSPKLPSII
jgi:hypothetical protein